MIMSSEHFLNLKDDVFNTFVLCISWAARNYSSNCFDNPEKAAYSQVYWWF